MANKVNTFAPAPVAPSLVPARLVTPQTAFSFDGIDFNEKQVVTKEHTQKAYVTKKGISKPAKLVPARITGAAFRPMTMAEYKAKNPTLAASGCVALRGSDMMSAAKAVSDDLSALVAGGLVACYAVTKKVNGHTIIDIGPTPNGAAKLTVDSALAFIANNPTHPAVVAYQHSLKLAV